VRFTETDAGLNLIFLGRIAGDRVVVKDLEIGGAARVLGDEAPVELRQIGPDLALTFRAPPTQPFAPVVQVGPA
jgi:hypothetical protein